MQYEHIFPYLHMRSRLELTTPIPSFILIQSIALLTNLVVMWQELELEKFITHEVPFSEINKAFEYMLSGAGLRCIIRMGA
jgi:hypothetical protein